LTPKLDAIVGEKDGLLELAKVDIDENPDLALQYQVSSGVRQFETFSRDRY